MKLTFLGTRGGIIARSKEHYMHSSLLIQYQKTQILIDRGQDWLNKNNLLPDALFLTHAHPDHAGGLKNGFACPIYASKKTLSLIKQYDIKEKISMRNLEIVQIGKIKVQLFYIKHSSLAPASGYKISAGKKTIFYAPDVISITNKKALTDVDIYIGDGAIINRKILMKTKNSKIYGHAPIILQVQWCKKANINTMIITHCGSEITKEKHKINLEKINKIGQQYNIKIIIATDGCIFGV